MIFYKTSGFDIWIPVNNGNNMPRFNEGTVIRIQSEEFTKATERYTELLEAEIIWDNLSF